MKTLFEKIIDRDIPADFVYEDDLCIAINDINPQAPIHILLIPKKPIEKLSDCDDSDCENSNAPHSLRSLSAFVVC